mgnify:CR=1 FL=1
MKAKMISGVILGGAFLALFMASVVPSVLPWPVSGPVMANFGMVKWEGRTAEVLYQGLILFAGVVAILLLLGKRRPRGATP